MAKIKEREESKLEKDDYNRKYGGVNLLLAAIALLVFYNLPTLLRELI